MCLDGINTATVSTVCIMLWKCLAVHYYNCTSEEDNTNESGQRCREMLSLCPGSGNGAMIMRHTEKKSDEAWECYHPWSHFLSAVSGLSVQTMDDPCSVEWRTQHSAKPWRPKF